MEVSVVLILMLLISYYPYKLYVAKHERLQKESEYKEGLYLKLIEVLDELSRRHETSSEEQQKHWENLSDVLTERVNVIVNEFGRDLTQSETKLIDYFGVIKTNKTNQADVFDSLFNFLIK
jgi:hypothetical protein